MTKRLLERDPLTGTERWFEYDPVTKECSIETVQDVEPILEMNKALQTHNDGYSKTREWRRAASIPNTLIYEWLTKEGIDVYNADHWPAVVRKLDSIEYRYLRTADGQIGKRVRHM
jgi:hypothetical protein